MTTLRKSAIALLLSSLLLAAGANFALAMVDGDGWNNDPYRPVTLEIGGEIDFQALPPGREDAPDGNCCSNDP